MFTESMSRVANALCFINSVYRPAYMDKFIPGRCLGRGWVPSSLRHPEHSFIKCYKEFGYSKMTEKRPRPTECVCLIEVSVRES